MFFGFLLSEVIAGKLVYWDRWNQVEMAEVVVFFCPRFQVCPSLELCFEIWGCIYLLGFWWRCHAPLFWRVDWSSCQAQPSDMELLLAGFEDSLGIVSTSLQRVWSFPFFWSFWNRSAVPFLVSNFYDFLLVIHHLLIQVEYNPDHFVYKLLPIRLLSRSHQETAISISHCNILHIVCERWWMEGIIVPMCSTNCME